MGRFLGVVTVGFLALFSLPSYGKCTKVEDVRDIKSHNAMGVRVFSECTPAELEVMIDVLYKEYRTQEGLLKDQYRKKDK